MTLNITKESDNNICIVFCYQLSIYYNQREVVGQNNNNMKQWYMIPISCVMGYEGCLCGITCALRQLLSRSIHYPMYYH
jgi:hypothetical protein